MEAKEFQVVFLEHQVFTVLEVAAVSKTLAELLGQAVLALEME
jgi:hypothetical protein